MGPTTSWPSCGRHRSTLLGIGSISRALAIRRELWNQSSRSIDRFNASELPASQPRSQAARSGRDRARAEPGGRACFHLLLVNVLLGGGEIADGSNGPITQWTLDRSTAWLPFQGPFLPNAPSPPQLASDTPNHPTHRSAAATTTGATKRPRRPIQSQPPTPSGPSPSLNHERPPHHPLQEELAPLAAGQPGAGPAGRAAAPRGAGGGGGQAAVRG